MKTRILALAAALLLPPLAADAQSYRCTSKDGKKYYGSAVPSQCIGQPVEVMNKQGRVVRRIDPEGTEKERAAKEAAEAKKREQLAVQREAARRNRALLATYTSAKDIDEARKRALADNHKAILDVETRIEQIRKRQAGYEKDLELYKSKGNPPARLADDLRNAEVDLKYQEELLAVKRKEVEHINARYDDDKKRYIQLTGRR
ncbi:MAG TPA: hypothetical protein VFZ84_21940 [Burkholderiales bacterium]